MREIVQMQKAKEIISTYDGKQPLQLHLKNYFRLHKEMGSRDRKLYTQLTFGYYRQKGMAPHNDRFLVDAVANMEQFHPFYAYWSAEVPEVAGIAWNQYFPFSDHISDSINIEELEKSLHTNPATWIRCKKAHITDILDELSAKGFVFDRDDTCIRFDQPVPLQELETFEKGYFEIQDIASQQTGTLMHPEKNAAWWDCCAGSGGKSLLLLEKEKQLQLFVSDNRESILHNLQDRFSRAGIRQFAAKLIDLETADDKALQGLPDMQGIIADVPCSGSGTWARTPERMAHFDGTQLEKFVALQHKILDRTVNKLLPGGTYLYLTCSVFTDENEQQVAYLQQQHQLTLQEMHYFQYSSQGGDTLFGARFTK